MRAIWITWEHQRRNISFANAIGAKYCEISVKRSRLTRYLICTARTISLIRREQPTHIFYQNPSIILATLIAISGRLLSPQVKLIGDYHNAGVFPSRLGGLTRFAARRSDIVIVTNDSLVKEVESWGATAISIPDPLPEVQGCKSAKGNDMFSVLFICSWADDEPVAEVIAAAERLQHSNPNIQIYITGRPKLERLKSREELPANVHLTGYLSHADFDQHLFDAGVVMDLTTREDCMVCGGYESTAAETPILLSDNTPTRAFFSQGAVFVDNSAADIYRGIIWSYENQATLKRDIRELKKEVLKRQSIAISKLITLARQ